MGSTAGHIFHGELALDQLATMRPLLGYSRYHSPVLGLYVCGAGTHPGGFMTGGSGKIAAKRDCASVETRLLGPVIMKHVLTTVLLLLAFTDPAGLFAQGDAGGFPAAGTRGRTVWRPGARRPRRGRPAHRSSAGGS